MDLLKKTSVLLIAVITCLSMVVTPVFMADEAYADDSSSDSTEFVMTDEMYNQIDGKNVSDLEQDEELSGLLEDPSFLRYFDVDDNGKITKKEVDLDEVDKFIADMDNNAEGIDDETLIEINEDMNAVGCGVSGLGKAEVPSKYKKLNKYNCIDISYWQGKVTDANWTKIKKAGVTHVILRVGYSGLTNGKHNVDSVFDYNIKGAYKAGLKIGIYYYSTAKTATEATSEAEYVVKQLKSYKSMISMPVAYDYETGGRLTTSIMKKNGTASCTAFCDKIKAAGYTPMVYANYTTLKNYLDYKTLQSKYPIWLAHYTTNGVATTYPGEYKIWQYSSSGKVNGLSGSIDINYIFGDDFGTATSSDTTTTDTSKVTVKYYAKVKSAANYRTGPGTEYTKVGTYKKNKIVSVVGTSGSWTQLKNGYFIKSKWLSKCNSYKVKTTGKVSYRTGPGTNYTKKGTYKKGKTLTVVYTTGSWSRLSNGYYVSSKWVKKI